MSEPDIHIGTCGSCGGNVTRVGLALPRCEQCGAEPVHGPILPMQRSTVTVPPITRDADTGRFQRGK